MKKFFRIIKKSGLISLKKRKAKIILPAIDIPATTSTWYILELLSKEEKIPEEILEWIIKRIKKGIKQSKLPWLQNMLKNYNLKQLVILWYEFRKERKHPNAIPRLIGKAIRDKKEVLRIWENGKIDYKYDVENLIWEIMDFMPKLKIKPKPRKRGRKKKKYPIEKWKKMKAQNMSIREIARETGYSKTTVQRYLSQNVS